MSDEGYEVFKTELGQREGSHKITQVSIFLPFSVLNSSRAEEAIGKVFILV